MATNWEAKFGKGKWVTVRGARVYIQEGKGLGAALQKLAGKKKTIKSPERKIPKLDDSAKKIIGKNEKTIVNAKTSYRNAINSNNLDDSHKAYVALGKAENAQSINRELKGRNREPELIRKTGATDYNNAQKKDSENAWVHDGHMASVKAGIKTARAAREAAGTNGKLRSPVYADQKTGKLKLASKPLGNGKKSFKNENDRKDVENNVAKRNEEKIKKYNQTGPNTDWEEFVKIDDAARHARNENQKIKAKNEPGRGQTISDYRNPQFTKGDNLSPVGNRHVTSRVTPDASKTGEADQELNQLYAQRRPYGNRTYNDPTLKGSWEDSVKTVIKNARATRKANGTEGKLRSDVYKDSPQQEAAAKAKKSAQNAKTISNPVQGKASGSFSAKDAMGKLNKLATTLNNGGGHPFDDWRQARDILEKAPVGTTITAQLDRGTKSVHIKKADGKWTNDSGAPYDTNTMSKYWYKGNNDIPEVDIYTPDMGKGSTRTPTLKEALKEKAGKKTRKK